MVSKEHCALCHEVRDFRAIGVEGSTKLERINLAKIARNGRVDLSQRFSNVFGILCENHAQQTLVFGVIVIKVGHALTLAVWVVDSALVDVRALSSRNSDPSGLSSSWVRFAFALKASIRTNGVRRGRLMITTTRRSTAVSSTLVVILTQRLRNIGIDATTVGAARICRAGIFVVVVLRCM